MREDHGRYEELVQRYRYLGHDDKLLARKLELLDCVAQDDLGETIRVHLCDTGNETTCVLSDNG